MITIKYQNSLLVKIVENGENSNFIRGAWWKSLLIPLCQDHVENKFHKGSTSHFSKEHFIKCF